MKLLQDFCMKKHRCVLPQGHRRAQQRGGLYGTPPDMLGSLGRGSLRCVQSGREEGRGEVFTQDTKLGAHCWRPNQLRQIFRRDYSCRPDLTPPAALKDARARAVTRALPCRRRSIRPGPVRQDCGCPSAAGRLLIAFHVVFAEFRCDVLAEAVGNLGMPGRWLLPRSGPANACACLEVIRARKQNSNGNRWFYVVQTGLNSMTRQGSWNYCPWVHGAQTRCGKHPRQEPLCKTWRTPSPAAILC